MSRLLRLLLIPTVFADSEILPSKRIFNGVDADPARFPYMVVLRDYFQNYACGGTLIAPDIVLSAAHCGESLGIATVQIGRYDGSNNQEADVETLVVDPTASVRHPSYDSDTMENDFYVIKLFGKSMHHSHIKINDADHVPFFEGSQLTVIGWGSTTVEQESFTSELQEASVRYVSNKICEAAEGTVDFDDDTVDDRFELWETYQGGISNDMLCAKGEGGDACWGDSGGPIFIKGSTAASDLQVGITSWGYSCSDREFPGVYARVSNQFNWIRENVCSVGAFYAPDYFGCSTESASGNTDEAAETKKITIQIAFDDRPKEQGFVLTSVHDGRVVHYQPIGSFDAAEPFEISLDVDAKQRYKFVYLDEGGDGFRQRFVNDGETPSFQIHHEGKVLVSSEVGKYFLFSEHDFDLSNGEIEHSAGEGEADDNIQWEKRDETTSRADETLAGWDHFVWMTLLHSAIHLAA